MAAATGGARFTAVDVTDLRFPTSLHLDCSDEGRRRSRRRPESIARHRFPDGAAWQAAG